MAEPPKAKGIGGYGQPFYAPFWWPISNMLTAFCRKANEIPSKASSLPYMGINDHVAAMTASLRNLVLGYCAVYYLYDDEQKYPAYGDAKDFDFEWMWPIVMRNILGCICICGLWEYFLYFSPAWQKMEKYKITQSYPSYSQMLHDMYFTVQASVIAALLECGLCHLWARGVIAFQHDMMETPILNVIGGLAIVHYRAPHFWFVHRIMHPWRFKYGPDVGKFLYKHAHYLHHKSHNTTAFSGTSMHPIEVIFYVSCAFMPLLFGAHPAHSIAVFIDCFISAWIGHSGFQYPGSGNFYHTLHHRHFDCNYGTSHVPFDYWFGTFAAEKEDVRKIWAK